VIGFIGLGIMGKPMAKHLLDKGEKLIVNDLDKSAVDEVKNYGATEGTYQDIAKNCPIIFTMLPNGKIVEDVLLKENGLFNYLQEGQIICDLSSINPKEVIFINKTLFQKKVFFLDSPVSGGESKALEGTLSMMVGGDAESFEVVKPLLLKMGSSAVLIGKSGSGSIAKLTNQIIVNMNIATVAEAFVLAMKSGLNVANVFQAIRGGTAGSNVLETKFPMMLERNFEPGGKISINRKDIGNVIEWAHSIDCPVPFTASLYEIFQSLKVAGQMDEDHSSIVKYFEKLADVEVSKNI